MRIGVDLGTTWTAAALHTEDGSEAVQLAQNTIAMPSVVAVADGKLVVGDAAERQLAVDATSGVREFKRRLGDSTPYVVAGSPYGAEALMGAVLASVVAKAVEQSGRQPDSVSLTHPASWGEFKLDLLRESAKLAEIEDIELISEPAAAALHYVQLGRLEVGNSVAVFDLGGGTFDAAIVELGADGPKLLGKPEGLERFGGVDVDQAVLAYVDSALDGQLRSLDTSDPDTRLAVARLRAECTAAKEALSFDTDTSIRVALPGLDTEVRLTRAELEQVLRPRVDDTLGALNRAVTSANLATDDLTGILLVGGSSRMPLVAEMVSSTTGRPALIDTDPKLAIAAGAAYPARPDEGPDAIDLPEPTSSAVAARAADRKPADTRSVRSEAQERGAMRLKTALGLAGAATAASASVVGGYYAYKTWWDADDGADEIAQVTVDDEIQSRFRERLEEARNEAETGVDDELDAFATDLEDTGSLDEFDFPTQPDFSAVAPPVASPGPAPAAPQASHQSQPVSRPGPPPQPAPTPQPVSRPQAETTETRLQAEPPPGPVFTDPELESVRSQLLERVQNMSLPDADPEDVAKLQDDLEGLLDRYQPYAGQSLDDAIASLRYEFEDRMRDFAQDQRIDALIEQQESELAEIAEVDAEVDGFRTQLTERLDGWEPPAGADPEDAAALKAELEAMVRDYRAIPGQTADQALAQLREAFNDKVGDFSQDLKIDAIVDELADDETPEPEPVGEDGPLAGDEPPEPEPVGEDGPLADVFDTDGMSAGDWGANAPADSDLETEAPPTTEEPVAPPEDVGPEDDLLGTEAIDEAVETTDPLILTAEGVQPSAPNPDDGRLTKDFIPDPQPVDSGSILDQPAEMHSTIVPGGEFFIPIESADETDPFAIDDLAPEDGSNDAIDPLLETDPLGV